MKAAVLTTIGGPLVTAEVGLGPLSYGQVRVRVLLSGICGAQLLEIDGHKGNAKYLPHLLGHEGSGRVEEVGPGVTRVRPGQKVVMHWRKAAGVESDPPVYLYRKKSITSGRVVTFCEQATCSENRLTPIGEDAPDELCALLGCSLSTALGIVERDAAIQFAERVLIIGCGGLGVNLIRACAMRLAGLIHVLDLKKEKRQLAYQMGATEYFDVSSGDWWRAAVLEGVKYDVILDTAGAALTAEQALPFLAPSGRFIMVGQPRPDVAFTLRNAVHFFEGEGKRLTATQGGGCVPHVDIPRYEKLWRMGKLNLTGIVTDTLPLSQVNRAIELVRDGQAGRVMLAP